MPVHPPPPCFDELSVHALSFRLSQQDSQLTIQQPLPPVKRCNKECSFSLSPGTFHSEVGAVAQHSLACFA